MAKESPNKPQRLDPRFQNDMKNIMRERLSKGLAKFNSRDLGFAEATRLVTRTESYKKLLEELRTKPKRYD